ncbi:MAG: S8 family serine peptidase, partial [Halobacteriales archaeon]|nr:S8 family serine peptidase [Halobacteriales archaeon]
MLRVAVAVVTLLLLAVPLVAGDAPAPQAARYVVGLHGTLPGAGLHGAHVVRTDARLGVAVVEATDASGFLAQARADRALRYVEPDPLLRFVDAVPDDPLYASQYGPAQVRADVVWDAWRGSADATVCVVDTGVRATHTDLAGAWLGGFDFVNNDTDPTDDHGHGTHVSGTAAARIGNEALVAGMGNVALRAAKVLDATGSGYASMVASGIRWCADQGPRTVISLSLGSTLGSTVLADAVDYAWAQGALVVAAAGNDGPCASCVSYPGAYDRAIAVACTDSARALCSFSSRGTQVD